MLTPKDERAYPIPTALLEGSGDFPQGSACEGSAPAGDSAMAAGPRGPRRFDAQRSRGTRHPRRVPRPGLAGRLFVEKRPAMMASPFRTHRRDGRAGRSTPLSIWLPGTK
jgi:hypothetical protein